MITWLNSYNYELINESDITTFYRKNDNSISNSVIDLAFITQKLSENISDWYDILMNLMPQTLIMKS